MIQRALVSALIGGATASVVTPILWPFLAITMSPQSIFFSSWDLSLLWVLVGIAVWAGALGLLFGLIVGFPVILLLHKAHLANPTLIILSGAASSALLFSGFRLRFDLWPLYLFLLLVVGMCSAVASWTYFRPLPSLRP
jgi:hypothetical protein